MNKKFNSLEEIEKYYDKKTNAYIFKENEKFIDKIVLNFDLKVESDIKACNIDALNIHVWNIYAEDIKSDNINACNIEACNIDAKYIIANYIYAHNIKALYIHASDIMDKNTIDVKDSNADYSTVCCGGRIMTSKEAVLELICEAKSVNRDDGRACFLRKIIEKDLDLFEEYRKIEEEIGVDFITLVKMLKDDVYINDGGIVDEIGHIYKEQVKSIEHWPVWGFTTGDNVEYAFKDRGRTWALDKEEFYESIK